MIYSLLRFLPSLYRRGYLRHHTPYVGTPQNRVKLHNYYTTLWRGTIHTSQSTRTDMDTSMETPAAPLHTGAIAEGQEDRNVEEVG